MELQRVESLTVERFLSEFVAPAVPCIIADGMRGWSGTRQWSPDWFRAELGAEYAQIYNDRFDLVNITTLAEYMDEYFSAGTPGEAVPYVRWYTKLKDEEFIWADDAFERLRGLWSKPYFLPDSGYLLPFCMEPDTISPVDAHFPARSIFVSGPGAATRLHYDPWGSDSILFQIHGLKRWTMYAPEQAQYLRSSDGRYVDLANPDLSRFPNFHQAKRTFEFLLRGGETIFVPAGWVHEVETLEGSISLTWNFVHRVAADRYFSYLASGESVGHDLEVLRFFYSKHVPPTATAEEIADYVHGNMVSMAEIH